MFQFKKKFSKMTKDKNEFAVIITRTAIKPLFNGRLLVLLLLIPAWHINCIILEKQRQPLCLRSVELCWIPMEEILTICGYL
ncbi:hypothetical protein HMPREF0322_00668 [Desulfitobacterium hafniense DP7]|uniref:Uncharacterized protein n=1 Tax=Desulfitobacterium hafniense DP7 TaxID=537010 RepID=G9XI92_DESHA|nr:hypothetical protein HMPREF0322_00668 [Desulfitobacterium hafniense DP7]